MKRRVFATIGAILAFALIAIYGVFREKELAIARAEGILEQLSTEPSSAERSQIPANLPLKSFELADTDYFDRSWQLWFDSKSSGRILITLHADRGIGVLPLLNSLDTLSLEGIEHHP